MMQAHHHRGQPPLPPQRLRHGLQRCSPLSAPVKAAISQLCHLLLLLQLPEVPPAKALRVRLMQLVQQLLEQLLLLGWPTILAAATLAIALLPLKADLLRAHQQLATIQLLVV